MKQKRDSGFVLLFGILITAVIFVLGAGILSIAQKETILSSTATESQVALGVADTGLECALRVVFAGAPDFVCAGQSPSGDQFGNQTTYSFDMQDIDPDSIACGMVTVISGATRLVDGVLMTGTEIQSRGFNQCIADGQTRLLRPNNRSPLLLERKLIVWYADIIPADPIGPGGGPANPTGPNTPQNPTGNTPNPV